MSIKGLEWTFDTVAEEYDKWRPVYVEELYKDIFRYKEIDTGSHVLEIGIGTGQATRPIIKTGCNITAVELGKNLAEIARRNFKDNKNITVINSAFQDYLCPSQLFDLVYSASAFHWIGEEEGYRKVYKILKSSGAFARFASHPFYNIEGQEELYDKIQYIYSKHMPIPAGVNGAKKVKRYTEEDAVRRTDIAKKYGFVDVETKIYYRDLVYYSEEYVKRLAIECDKIALNSDARSKLLNGIKNAIDEHGGKIIIRDMIDLNLARKA